MNDNVKPKAPRKKTPADATPFERDQLRFFLSAGDLAATLSEVNPSLAWLPVLSEMHLIQSETQLIPWIERNFGDADAVRDVVANIHFFGRPETARFLEYRLNAQAGNLPPLLAKSWALIIRHMRAAKGDLAHNGWFDIVPQLNRGDYSVPVLDRLVSVLRPQLKIGARLSLSAVEAKAPERPSDLMSIDYEVEDGVSSDDVLAAWPNNAPADTDENLLLQLTTALGAALADATDAGVESKEGYSTSDSDVPSVARHIQNEYRSGFQLIVRVMAEVWTRLADKSPSRAIAIAERWRDCPFRLMWRLAMFSFADPAVPAKIGADMLINVPAGELFLANSSVEVYRLIRARWNEFPAVTRRKILSRLCDGPPRTRFREGAEIDSHIDRSRFDILSEMVRDGFDIGRKAEKLLTDIRARWPQWEPRPSEQAGFHIWSEGGTRELGGDTSKLQGVGDSELVDEARKIAATAAFMEGDSWQGLCLSDPDRALRGLAAAAINGNWYPEYWEQLLWSGKKYADGGTEQKIAELLLQWPQDSFDRIAAAAAAWFDGHATALPDTLLWPLWDRIADKTLIASVETGHA
jgi:hypothetical protein